MMCNLRQYEVRLCVFVVNTMSFPKDCDFLLYNGLDDDLLLVVLNTPH